MILCITASESDGSDVMPEEAWGTVRRNRLTGRKFENPGKGREIDAAERIFKLHLCRRKYGTDRSDACGIVTKHECSDEKRGSGALRAGKAA